MDETLPETAQQSAPDQTRLSPLSIVLLAMSFGLFGGYLDLGVLLFKRFFLNPEGSFRSARDFPWTVPVGHVALMIVPGLVVATINGIRRKPLSLRASSWWFATLASWGALARLPIHNVSSLLLAAGLGRLVSAPVASLGLRSRALAGIRVSMAGLLIVLAVLSSGWQVLQEYRVVAGLPAAPAGARNVVLIVWDTVRSYNLSLSGYYRDTTPHLKQWAQRGVNYRLALAPAPWTYPSHASFFTGWWPFQINSQWKYRLDTPHATLAEYLASRGYQTAGFAANTNCCNYETGLSRGFAHYEDYSLKPWSLLSRTVPGKWILANLLSPRDYFSRKWFDLQSLPAREVNGNFLTWIGRRRPDRPFFAFLNYFDAHEPYFPPREHAGHFGIQPESAEDYAVLTDFVGAYKRRLRMRDIDLARDGYDDCIASLDEQLGRLLESLREQGLLENTDVIITSDHGEAFGEHQTFGHSYSVMFGEVGVPLVILSPLAPAGKLVANPVSLRDLPATIVDLLGLSVGSPFPGHSLAVYWGKSSADPSELTTPALSEQADATAFQTRMRTDGSHAGFQMSLVTSGHHYIRTGRRTERLYDLNKDPYERDNLLTHPDGGQRVEVFRRKLLEVLSENLGSVEAEASYLWDYRNTLEILVRGPAQKVTAAP
jgi:arylsulfatase A-like enzyme